jgi:putative flavoprotein involved in K+ transport
VPRTVAVDGKQLVLADGQRLNVTSVVWATGFRPDFTWLQRSIFDVDGLPRHTRGIVEGEPGLYVLGLRFLSRLNSSLLNGVGADAEHLTAVIAARTAGKPDPRPPDPPRLASLSAYWRRFWVRVLLAQTPSDTSGLWKPH